jgi:T-complex protein 1 subunit epsilon
MVCLSGAGWVGVVQQLAQHNPAPRHATSQPQTPNPKPHGLPPLQIGFGTTKDTMIIVEGCPNLKAVTLFLRAGNKASPGP